MKARIPKVNIADHNAKISAKQQVSKKIDLSEKLKKSIAIYCRPDIRKRFEAEKELNIQKQNLKNYALLHGFKVVEEIKEIGKEQERIRM